MKFSHNENLHQQVAVLIQDGGSMGYGARELEESLAPHLDYDRCREILEDFVSMGYISKKVSGDLRVYPKTSRNSAPKRSKDTVQKRDVRSPKKVKNEAGGKASSSLSSSKGKRGAASKKRVRAQKKDGDYNGSGSDESSSEEDSDDDSGGSDDDASVASSVSEKPKGRAKIHPKKLKRTPKTGNWTSKQDAELLLSFLAHIFNSKDATPFRGSIHPQSLHYMVSTLFTDGQQPAGHPYVISRTRLLSLLEAFSSMRGMVSFVLLTVPTGIDYKLRKAFNKFLEDTVENLGGALARDTAVFTAGLRHAHAQPDADLVGEELVKSTKVLRKFGWLKRPFEAEEGIQGPSSSECFTEGITSTYKAMLSSSNAEDLGDVSRRIVQSYEAALDPQKKEVSSAEGLLVAHGIFTSARELRDGLDKTDTNCFTVLDILRTKGDKEAAVVGAIKSQPGERGGEGQEGGKAKKITVGEEETTKNEKGHYDKPLNRIGFEVSFGTQGHEKDKPKPKPKVAAKEGKEKKLEEGCPWLDADGSCIPSLFDDLAAKLVAVLASVPGASVERLHASLGLLSLRQTEVLLADMVLKGMVKRHTPEMGVRSAGLFADEKAPARQAVYFAY